MTHIREYLEQDAESAGMLIADTYAKFNLRFATPEQRDRLLGPFLHAHSQDPVHREAIVRVIHSRTVLVAEDEGEIVGVLRGSKDRLHSLFVRSDCHRQGIGRALLDQFEQACLQLGGGVIRLASSLYAVPFYQHMGYFKSTGVRRGWSFQGQGLRWQPMKKILG